jgi:Flp pilus assembly protein TadD
LNDAERVNADFNEAFRIDPKNEDFYDLRGQAKFNLKDAAGAIKDFNAAIALDPQDPSPYLNRGLAKVGGDNKGACADMNKALQLGSKAAAAAIKKYCH